MGPISAISATIALVSARRAAGQMMSSGGPSPRGATNTSDFTICACSTPSARAASAAVWVVSASWWISSRTPLRAAASKTRRTAGSRAAGSAGTRASTGLGTGPSLASRPSAATGRVAGDPLRFVAVRAILFDWDGTLVDTLPFMYATTELVMAEHGVVVTWDDYRRHFTPDWRQLYRRFRLPEEEIESVGDRWWSLYRGRDEAGLPPGAADALRRLAAAGFALGVVTAGRRDSVEAQ